MLVLKPSYDICYKFINQFKVIKIFYIKLNNKKNC